ncbi:MAG: aminodeoxychorismate/anthranilate synthase component II [Candidatus Diapherotrites archaeon]|nr:aminodeoxychorismate/anthranilate synthase component II [Candidatus Diapherotrites archaeon]
MSKGKRGKGARGKGINVLFIDNFDSFTYNLVDEFAKRGCRVKVFRNNIAIAKIKSEAKKFKARLIVISPGPSTPERAGNSIAVIKEFAGKIPVFGVCLGLQAMVVAFGGKVARAPETVHGKPSDVVHDGRTIFEGITNPFSAGRYHSLCAVKVPSCLQVSALSESKVVMALRHEKSGKTFCEGVQFHPESILTQEGGKIIENIIKMAERDGR